jgi:type I restriction enzyme M protein
MANKTTHETEVEAYKWIKDRLKDLNWDVRNPSKVESGRVWTQNQYRADSELKLCLGLSTPENIIKVSEKVLWVVEAKHGHTMLQQALSEACDYAKLIRESKIYSPLFVTGVAGNDLDGYLVRTNYWNGVTFDAVRLNGIVATGLLSLSQLQYIISTGNANITAPQIDEKLFLSVAARINGILHLGAIPPHQRASVMASLLLSMIGDTEPNIEAASPSVLVNDINGRVHAILVDQKKPEFYEFIKIALPAAPDNHVKFRGALVKTLQELRSLNIRSAMNSGTDWLGAFYEVFLKYANWAQKLGIVLTPRHVTRFVADVMDILANDLILDITCGTGGFLVAGLDSVKQKADEKQLGRFKRYSVFGVEQDDGIAALAVVNMIFRGDGKNNIRSGNAFQTFLAPTVEDGITTAKYSTQQQSAPPMTKVMMNPPFAIKRSDEKEYRFIEQALNQIQHGGMLFSVLPYSAMVRPGAYRSWRRDSLLPQHTLVAVVTFPPDLFYPVGVTTIGVFIRKGIPHQPDQKVLWIRALHDGLLKSKGKRLPKAKEPDELAKVRDLLKSFLHGSQIVQSIEEFQKAAPIDWNDKLVELVPEAYLDQKVPTELEIKGGLEDAVRQVFAYLVRINRIILNPSLLVRPSVLIPKCANWAKFTAQQLFTLERGSFHSIADLDQGKHVTISRISTDNGFVGFFEKPDKAKIWPAGTITVSTVTGDAFLQPVPFIATDNVVLCTLKPEYGHLSLASLFFVTWALNTAKWRYSYGRQCYKTKFAGTEVFLPVTNTVPDESFMETMVNNTTYWPFVETVMQNSH